MDFCHRRFSDICVFRNEGFFLGRIEIRLLAVIFIICSVLIVLISKLVTEKLCQPLKNFEELVDYFMHDKELGGSFKAVDYKLLELRNLQSFLIKAFSILRAKRADEKAFYTKAVQTAHNIRSPAIALKNISEDKGILNTEASKVILDSANRINNIANNLLRIYKKEADIIRAQQRPALIWGLIDSIIVEKKAQFKKRRIGFRLTTTDEARWLFSKVSSIDFKSVISNLINNAVNAAHKDKASIAIKLSNVTSDRLRIEIADNVLTLKSSFC